MKLRRSSNAALCGVCAGIAERMGWSPSGVRLAVATVAVLDPLCVVGALYVLAAWLVPPPN